MHRLYIKIIVSIFGFGSCFAQIKQGDAFAARNEYLKAISAYKKALKETYSINPDAHLKLAECYRRINDYQNSEDNYKKALGISQSVDPEVFFNYAQVLKTNNKYTEAVEQYINYIKFQPKDTNAKKALKFCKDIKYYTSRPAEYQVKNIDRINTAKSEFSPVIFQNKLVFTSEKESFNFVNYNVSDYNGEPYLNMYIADIDGSGAKKEKTLAQIINTSYHDGPGCLSEDGKTFYFTRVTHKRKQGFVNTAKIYIASGEFRHWKNITSFTYNSDDYSVAHPSISHDGSVLFFVSDMPGGMGGKDIWCCQRNGDGWDRPVNLGPAINTAADEMFPTIRRDGILFFSSNGLPGFGGLDIFSAKYQQGNWIPIRNEGLNINSRFDDFGISFASDSTGYFSSNRNGGKGKDDIYWYKYTNKLKTVPGDAATENDIDPAKYLKFALEEESGKRIDSIKSNLKGFYWYKYRDKTINVSGTVLLTEDLDNPAKNVKVVLADETGKRIDSIRTNLKGFFEFKNMEADKKYMAIIDSDDPQFAGKAKYYLADGNNLVQRITNKQGNQKFVFKNLPVDSNSLPELNMDDDLTLAGNLLYGDNPSKPVKNSKIKLVNEAGDVIEVATTNEFGAFAFRNIPNDQNYMISIEESDIVLPANTKVTLTNKSGKELKTFNTQNGKFNFKVLASEKTLLKEMDAADIMLSMDVFGYVFDQDKKPIASAKIRIKEEGTKNEFQEVSTAENGRFNFKNLKGDKNYMFETDEKDPALKTVKKIFIADSKGRIYKVIERDVHGNFAFKMLESDKASLGEFVVEDPWLQVLQMKNKKDSVREALTVIENIYYEFGDHRFDKAGKIVLDKVISILKSNPHLFVEISSHTDSKASDDFNLALSKKRAQYVVDYLVSKGIDRKRLKAIGYGESKLLNRCSNGVDCYDEEHAMNRRTEFKVSEASKS